jgi:hypothetical protein
MFRRQEPTTVETNGPAGGEEQVGPVAQGPGYMGHARRRLHGPPNPGAGFGLGTVGMLALLVGAWAGIVPFVGPLFGYSATGTGSWVWNLSHALVWVAPGAAAVLLSLVLMATAPAVRAGAVKLGTMWAGLIVALSGAWLVVGPMAWPALESRRAIVTARPLHEFVYWIGYSFGPGLLLAALGGIAMGIALLARRAEVVSTAAPMEASDRMVA